MIEFACPICGKRYRVADSAKGKATQCLQCGERIRVPSGQVKPVDTVNVPIATSPSIAVDPNNSDTANRHQRPTRTKLLSLGLALVIVVPAGTFFAARLFNPASTPSTTATVPAGVKQSANHPADAAADKDNATKTKSKAISQGGEVSEEDDFLTHAPRDVIDFLCAAKRQRDKNVAFIKRTMDSSRPLNGFRRSQQRDDSLDDLLARVQSSTITVPVIDPFDLSVGDIGMLGRVEFDRNENPITTGKWELTVCGAAEYKVTQVFPDSVLLSIHHSGRDDGLVLLENIDTTNIVTGSKLTMADTFKVVGTKTYTTVLGGTNTVFVIRRFDSDAVFDYMKQKAKEMKAKEEKKKTTDATS